MDYFVVRSVLLRWQRKRRWGGCLVTEYLKSGPGFTPLEISNLTKTNSPLLSIVESSPFPQAHHFFVWRHFYGRKLISDKNGIELEKNQLWIKIKKNANSSWGETGQTKKSTHRLRPAKNMENMKNHVPGAPHNARARARGAESFFGAGQKTTLKKIWGAAAAAEWRYLVF